VTDAHASLLVVWHSRTGASRQLANAAVRGARDSLLQAPGENMRQVGTPGRSIGIDCVHARRADAQRVCASSAYIFVAPENLASLSGVMKDFFDRTYYGVLDRVAGRPYAVIIAAGSDGQGAARQVERIATGWRLKPVAEPIIVITHAQATEAILAPKRVPAQELARASELGAAMAQGLALGIF
jgi:multimeric flavodoxin WrbA